MMTPIIFIIIGAFLLFLSLFLSPTSKKLDERVEQISISLHKDTNELKQRVKRLEEELLISSQPQHFVQKAKQQRQRTQQPIHAIIVNQILALHKQGYDTTAIAKRASLSEAEVIQVLVSEGVKK